MGSVIHIAEVAAILTVAYLLGSSLGFMARWAAEQRRSARAAMSETPAEQQPEAVLADPLVKAPVIDPVPQTAPPAFVVTEASEPATPPEPIPHPTPVPAAPVELPALRDAGPQPITAASTPFEAGPAEQPIETAAARLVNQPPPAPALVEEVAKTAPVAAPATVPGQAWSGLLRGQESTPLRRQEPPTAIEPVPAERPAEVPLTIDLGPVGPDALYGEPVLPPQPEPEVPLPAEAMTFGPEPQPAPMEEIDEAAAMRAIEGGWSRVQARALPDEPELSDVGAAVAAAQS
ncbi:MAG TPA: hypothetical protein VFE52_04030, partial [Devosia sp.]|nr:hypothetical protein [Devosia sp.]